MPKNAQSTLNFGGKPLPPSNHQSTLNFNGPKAAKKSTAAAPLEKEKDATAEQNGNGHPKSASPIEPKESQKRTASSVDGHDEDDDEQPVIKRQRKHIHVEEKPANGSSSKLEKFDDDVKVQKKPASPAPVDEDDESDPSSASELDEDDVEEEAPSKSAPKKPAEKGKAATKSQKQLQTVLGEFKDPYPDWKAGEPVPYAALCTTFSLIELTSKRLLISSYTSAFLKQVLRLTPDDLLPVVQLMVNKLAADYEGIELGIGESLIMKAICEATGRNVRVIKEEQAEIGDLGLVAMKSRSTQGTMFKPKPLTVKGVLQSLMAIATAATGSGNQQRKVDGIKKLLSAADVAKAGQKVDITKDKGGPSETKYIVRFLEGKLRLGLAEKTIIIALANAMVCHEVDPTGKKQPSAEDLTEGESILKSVYSELPNYEIIVPAMLQHGISHLREECKLRPGVPLKPMLAKPTKSITEVLDRFEGKEFTCEYKYDGERAQIHFVAAEHVSTDQKENPLLKKDPKGLAAIFSRNSEDLSKKYPDILAKLDRWIKPSTKSFVLDCETVAWDIEQKKVLPFQQLMTRKKKDVKAEDVKVKVCVFAFDMLYYNGEAVVQKSLRERRELLHSAFTEVEGEFRFAQSGDTADIDEIQTLLDESVKASCEGLMVKMLDTDESGYEPSKRSRNWLKVKKDYLQGIGDSLDLVVLGAYFGKGKRTSVYGAFLLACYNSTDDTYESVCNIGTGFSDAILEEFHTQLKDIVIEKPKPFYVHPASPKDRPDVWFEPRYVWEVKTADLTLSPRYKAGAHALSDATGKGISLRFPRFIKIREDKKPDDATESKMLVAMYRKQESIAKQKGPAVDDDFEY